MAIPLVELDEDYGCYLQGVQLRQYQAEMVETTRKQNSIVFLPAGCGKTFIALLTLRSKIKDIKKCGDKPGKIAVFLGNTKPLVKQLAKVVEENTPLKVKLFTAEQGVTGWSAFKWGTELFDQQVLCMVPAIFQDLLFKQLVSLKNVALIVMDECHRCVGKHPFNMIMNEFQFVPENERPLVLGLTSTVLNSNPSKTMREIQELKANLRSTFVKTKYLVEAISYGTNATDIFVEYETDKTNAHEFVVQTFKESEVILTAKCLSDARAVSSDIPAGCFLIDNKKTINRVLKNMFVCTEKVLKSLGLMAAAYAGLFFTIKLEKMMYKSNNSLDSTICRYGVTIFSLVRRIISRYVNLNDPQTDVLKYSSLKFKMLIKTLDDYKFKERNNCIIFVHEKITACVLASLLTRLGKYMNDDHYSAEFITGGLFNSVFECNESAEEHRRQKSILENFRAGKFKLLVATSVLEEGFDLPQCSLVIQFDGIKEYRTYVQSKGRARFKDSVFVIFKQSNEEENLHKKIELYKKLNQFLLREILSETSETFDDLDDSKENIDEDEEYFRPSGSGSHLSATACISFVFRYCQSLPQDKFSSLAPVCWYNPKDKRAYLRLPPSSAVRKTIQGDEKPSVKSAKKNVFLKAVKELFKAGEIRKDFSIPSYKCRTEEYLELFVNLKERDKSNNISPNSKNKWGIYNVQKAESLSFCLPQPHGVSYMHIIRITPVNERPTGRSGFFYDIFASSDSFAILSSKRMSKICDFPLFLNFASFNCSLLVNAETVQLSEEQLENIRIFHFFIFNTVLNVVNRLQVMDNSNTGHSFYVVPVKSKNADSYEINWEIVKSANELMKKHESLRDMIDENPKINDFALSMVYPKYQQNIYIMRYYFVTSVDNSQSPMSKFPSDSFPNYYKYFLNKYRVKIEDESQPMLEVKALTTRLDYLKPRKALHKKNYFDEDNDKFKEYLVPELCHRHLFNASVWVRAIALPSALYRIMTISKIDDFRKRIASETKIGVVDVEDTHLWCPLVAKTKPDDEELNSSLLENSYSSKTFNEVYSENKSELDRPIDLYRNMSITAPCDLKHYLKYFQAAEKSEDWDETGRNQKEYMLVLAQLKSISVVRLPTLELDERTKGPELRDFVEVFTCKSAVDIVDLESLEFFGDSFLKFSCATYLFRNYNKNEAVLSGLKDQIVSNENLKYYAELKDLVGNLNVYDFQPMSEWNAPLFCLPEEIRRNLKIDSNEIDYNFKLTIAEKLSGKLGDATVKELEEQINIKNVKSSFTLHESLFDKKRITNKSLADCVEALVGLYLVQCGLRASFGIVNWLQILPPALGSYSALIEQKYVPDDFGLSETIILDKLKQMSFEDLEDILDYKFRHKSLLLEALTHPSAIYCDAACYQRLEFLGDAVTDFDPGKMTDIRSAVVNNTTMAFIVAKYGLYKYLIYEESSLMHAISDFVRFRKEAGHVIDKSIMNVGESSIPKALGDLFESLIGAVFLDSGNSLTVVWNVFFKLLKEALENFTDNPPINPVRMLYEICRPAPQFRVQSGNSTEVEVEISHNDKTYIFMGRSKNLRMAKIIAARHALEFLDKEKRKHS